MANAGFHTFLDYPNEVLPAGIIVPQAVYSSSMAGFTPRPPVKFYMNGQLGIRLSDAYSQTFTGLAGSSERIILNEGMKVSTRILWPGYPAWAKQVHVFTHGEDRTPISRSRVAYLIAKTVLEYLGTMANGMSSEPRPDWWLSGMSLDDLFLLELRNASQGTWQPVFCRAA